MKKIHIILFVISLFAFAANAQETTAERIARKTAERQKKEAEEKNSQANAQFAKESIVDDGITSETHKANVGKMVFSKSPIVQGAENPANFSTNFSGKDLIYARCYLPKSLYNTPLPGDETYRNTSSTFKIEILIDNQKPDDMPDFKWGPYTDGRVRKYFMNYSGKRSDVEWKECSFPYNDDSEPTIKELNKKTTLELYINTSKEDQDNFKNSDWAFIVSNLKEGEHNIKFILIDDEDKKGINPICIGEFKYTKKTGENIARGKDFASFKLKSSMKDPSEARIKEQLELAGNEEMRLKIVKLGFKGDSWTVHKDYKGNPVKRVVEIWFVGKDSWGFCKIGYATVVQDHEGGKYGQAYLEGGRYLFSQKGTEYVDCSTVK